LTFLNTSPALAKALAERNYASATPVQSAVLAEAVADRDILVSAQTGSGKTVAFGLAIARTLLGDEETLPAATAPLALIVAPTRELALQVERELTWLYRYTRARTVACVGGMDARAERRRLQDGAHIVVGTPGRLRDHIERNGLDASALKAVVLDEADEMLDMGFREDLEFILDATPESRRTLLFSATMPKGIAALAQRYQRNAQRIDVASAASGHADIEYRGVRVAPKEIEHVTVNLLRFYESQTAIVFCNTRDAVRHLHATLVERGFSAVLLSGELGQHERNQSMQALRDGRARVCIATDVAARGIDLPALGLVIHADLPHDAEALQHRSGRTGRAGRKGVSVLLVPNMRRGKAERMLREAGVTAQWSGPPLAQDIEALDRDRMLQDPLLTEAPGEQDLELGRLLLERRTPEELAAILARVWRARQPAIEDVGDPGEDARGSRGASGSGAGAGSGAGGGPAKRGFGEQGAWFRLDIGRSKNADPKWLLPMLCRKGGLTRDQIGAIRIFDTETKVEIAEAVAANFAANMRRPGGDSINVVRIPGGPGPEPAGAKRKFTKKPGKPGRRTA